MSEEASPGVFARVLAVMRRLAAVACGGVGLWLGGWTVYVGALWWFGLGVSLLWPGRWFRKAMYGVLGLSLVPWCLLRYDARAQHLQAAVAQQGPEVLSVVDLTAIVGLNVVMGSFGYAIGFREVGLETLRLVAPGASARRWEDRRFPSCAPRVAEVVERRRQQALQGRGGPWTDRVAWKGYGPSSRQSMRAGLALNPVQVRTRLEGDVLVVEATVPVDYPPRARTVLLSAGPFEAAVEEGLFHAAEARGWLHPYELTWVNHIPLEGELPPPCEAWSVRLALQISTATWPW